MASLLLFLCILRRQEGLLHIHLQEEQKLRSTIYKRDLYVHGLANKCPEKLTVNFLQVDIQLIRTRDKAFLKFYTLCHQNTLILRYQSTHTLLQRSTRTSQINNVKKVCRYIHKITLFDQILFTSSYDKW